MADELATSSQERDRTLDVIHGLASLRFAAVLLMMLAVAMAYGTFYETSRGAELARSQIYDSTWFRLILGLIALNMVLSVLVRYPFSRRQIGFIITHGAIAVILVGAIVTGVFGVRGQVTLLEGQSTDRFASEQAVLVLSDPSTEDPPSVPVNVASAEPVENPSISPVSFDGVTARVVRYFPDAVPTQRVVNDNPEPAPAIRVSVAHGDHENSAWLFPDQLTRVGPLQVELQVLSDPNDVDRVLAAAAAGGDAGGYLEVTVGEQSCRVPLRENIGKEVPVDGTDVRLRIEVYLPHAQVGTGGLRSVSDRPVNPAAIVYVIRGDQQDRRICFALHPDFSHGQPPPGLEDVRVVLKGIEAATNEAEVLVLLLPDDSLRAAFLPRAAEAFHMPAAVGTPLQTPWAETTLTVVEHLEHARQRSMLEPITPPRETTWPALQVEVRKGQEVQEVPVQMSVPASVEIGGKPYRLSFQNKQIELGFTLALDDFTVGTYPGTERPRSFESRVQIQDQRTGRSFGGVISMNAPLKHGGYTLFQSGYDQRGQRMSSTLSVARDPGMGIVFAGYIAAIAGMIIVLITRISVYRRARALMDE